MSINKNISDKVLTVGSQYKNHRGGIGGVIETYSHHFDTFNFICSYGTTENKLKIILNFIVAFFKLGYTLLINKKVRIIHIHGAAKGSFFRKYILFNLTKRFFFRNVIFHCHGSEMEKFYNESSKLVRWVFKDFFNNVDVIICLSTSWKKFFEKNFNARHIIILENIVEEVQFVRQERVANTYITFLFLGALGERKGIFDLLEVIASNKDKYSDYIKVVVGGNGEIRRFKEFVNKYELNDIVSYRGWISGNEKLELLKESDVYILPSYNEGLPLSILEAMSYNMPIISTSVGGIPEVVVHLQNGYLIEPGNKVQIKSAIDHFIDNPNLIYSYGNSSSKLVKPYYASMVIPKLEKIYKEILHGL